MPTDDTGRSDAEDGDDSSESDGSTDEGSDSPLARVEAMDTERYAEAVVTGGVSYVVGYLVTGVLFFLGPAALKPNVTTVEELGRIGVVFNAAHYVDVDASHPVIVIANDEQTNLGSQFSLFEYADLLGAGFGVPQAVFVAIPVVLLFTIGASRAWRVRRSEPRWKTVYSTLGMAVGYGAVAYLGTLLFSYPVGEVDTVDGTAVVARQAYTIRGGEIGTAVLQFAPKSTGAILTGIAFPLLFATMGALAGVSLRERQSPDETTETDEIAEAEETVGTDTDT